MEQHKKKKISPLIVGAGGVASYLLPCLIRTFEIENGIIADGDILEERNLDRQLFSEDQIGENKATALSKFWGFSPHTEYVSQGLEIRDWQEEENKVIICCVDNHPARAACLEIAQRNQCRCYFGCNEYYDAQAYVYDPEVASILNPTNRYPAILTSEANDPINCQGDELESHPQLAMSNMMAAAMIMQLMWVHEILIQKWEGEPEMFSLVPKYPVELLRTEFSFDSFNEEDIEKLMEVQHA